MRTLVLTRGAPGCGKSTWIKNTFGADVKALSADEIRLMVQNPIQAADDSYTISQDNDAFVWDILFKILEQRMTLGEFTVIDATNSKTSEMTRYKNLADKYRYRIFVVDFTDIHIDEVKNRNAKRLPEYKRVPEIVIDNQYARFETQSVPSGITVIKPNELNKLFPEVFNMSHYEKVFVIGDVHGCYTVLKKFMDDHYSEKNMFIFTGDYLDRGIENVETLKYLMEIVNYDNVLLLEGNHERWIRLWANNEDCKRSKEFYYKTRVDLENAGFDKKAVRRFVRKIGQFAWFQFDDQVVFACHGGINRFDQYLSTNQLIKGVGKYEDAETVAKNWNEYYYNDGRFIQVFGHRNINNTPVKINNSVYCVEGKVEFGGCLRAVEFNHGGIKTHEYKNDVFREVTINKQLLDKDYANVDVGEIVQLMRNNKYIKEKAFGDISSFNFTREAFSKGIYDNMSMRARGLYVDTVANKVVARAYNKFFNLNERNETKVENLKSSLKFPVKAYLKENGFLGLISVYNDEFFFASKSSIESEHAKIYMKNLFDKQFAEGSDERARLKDFLKEANATMVVEVVDIENDPHIIEYKESKLVLLDIVHNCIGTFSKMSYKDINRFGQSIGMEVKKLYKTIQTFEGLLELIDKCNDINASFDGIDGPIEGFVFEDYSGFMFKLKTEYYKYWKSLRTLAVEVQNKGYSEHTSKLIYPQMNRFYGFLKAKFKGLSTEERKALLNANDIISLRREFLDLTTDSIVLGL